jgi:hypothetical protein
METLETDSTKDPWSSENGGTEAPKSEETPKDGTAAAAEDVPDSKIKVLEPILESIRNYECSLGNESRD